MWCKDPGLIESVIKNERITQELISMHKITETSFETVCFSSLSIPIPENVYIFIISGKTGIQEKTPVNPGFT
jgi:hypothetical protein